MFANLRKPLAVEERACAKLLAWRGKHRRPWQTPYLLVAGFLRHPRPGGYGTMSPLPATQPRSSSYFQSASQMTQVKTSVTNAPMALTQIKTTYSIAVAPISFSLGQ